MHKLILCFTQNFLQDFQTPKHIAREISHCCLHRASLLSYFSKNCSNNTHYVMILKGTYRINYDSKVQFQNM